MVDVLPCVYVRLPVEGNGFSLPFPHGKFSSVSGWYFSGEGFAKLRCEDCGASESGGSKVHQKLDGKTWKKINFLIFLLE